MRFVALALVGVSVGLLTPGLAQARTLECAELPGLFRSYTIHHFTQRTLSAELRKRTAQELAKIVDPSRVMLLASEVADLESEADVLFAQAQLGKCERIEAVMDLLVERANEDLTLAKNLLGPKYALDKTVELQMDPDKRGFAKTAEERAGLVEDLMHIQIASFVLGGLELDKAKAQLLKRYELNVKRAEERRNRKKGPEILASTYALALDPHSSYLSSDQLTDFTIQMQLCLEGIGAALRSDLGFTYIESLIPGGAAERSEKLQPKDKIIAVAQDKEEPVSTIDMDIRDVVKLIRGKKGTKVTLTILRESPKTRTLDVTIVRDRVDVAQQAAKIDYETRTVGKKSWQIGVLELPSFYGGDSRTVCGQTKEARSSYEDVKSLVAEAVAKKVDGLVLDLSRNGGGLLQDAGDISGLFIRKGAVVATRDTRGRLEFLEDDDKKTQYDGPLAVMVSPISASGAEILAGALQAYRRAVIVGGPNTFGKGTVQAVLPLPAELGAMKITTGMFFLPSGESTQFKGVAADVEIPSLMGGVMVGERDLDFALPPQSIEPFLSPSAASTWKPVGADTITNMRSAAAKRVSGAEAFEEIAKYVAEAKEGQDVVKVKELLGDEGDDGADDPDRFERLQEAFSDAAVDTLIDLARAQATVETAKN